MVIVVWRVTGSEDWKGYIRTLLIYAALCSVLFAVRKNSVIRRLSALVVLLDAWVIWSVQLRSMPFNAQPSGVAGFSLGLFALLVAMNSLTLRSQVIYLAAAVSAVAECDLMHEAGVTVPAMLIAAAVLFVEARALQLMTHRMRQYLSGLAGAEADRQFEKKKVEEIERARVTIEGMLAESRDQNEKLQRLQADRDRLSQLLVHDLRAPLTVLVGSIELAGFMVSKAKPAQQISPHLDTARGTAFRLTEMIGDILNVSALEDGRLPVKREEIDVTALLESLARSTALMHQERKHAVDVQAEPIRIDGDRKLLTRVMENLASNAARYTPKNGRVRFTAQAEERFVAIGVHNEGPAIDAELRAQLFDKYRQAKKGGGGWGLGLYFCRLVLEAHGGVIAAENVDGWATSIVLRIPRTIAQA